MNAKYTTARTEPIPTQFSYPPRYVQDQNGEYVGVILSYEDYKTYLRVLASQVDWDVLPPYLQDAIDNLLADEALMEDGEPIALRDALAETDELPE